MFFDLKFFLFSDEVNLYNSFADMTIEIMVREENAV